MICEYKDCENPAEATIFTNGNEDDPICVVCSLHKDMIEGSPIASLAVEAHLHRTVWLAQPSYPGKAGSIN